jgi:ParB-like chromosome segregation protein Spo0J
MVRPAHLDALVARVEAGSSYEDEDEGDMMNDRYGGRGRGPSDDATAERLEDMEREQTVLRMQNEHMSRQLKGALAELALHKKHAEEFKALLELAEVDLCAAHEHSADLSQRLQLAQEGNRRTADMAQQLLMHLDTTRVELKAQTRRVELLENARATRKPGAATEQHAQPGLSSGGPSVDGAVTQASDSARDASAGPTQPTGDALLAQLSSRAALTPVTHDVGVQVDLGSASRADGKAVAGVANAKLIALQHAQELERINGDGSAPRELAMEARPNTGRVQ